MKRLKELEPATLQRSAWSAAKTDIFRSAVASYTPGCTFLAQNLIEFVADRNYIAPQRFIQPEG